jgi:uncharacterized protein
MAFTRRKLLKQGITVGAGLATISLFPGALAQSRKQFDSRRPPPSKRRFASRAVEDLVTKTTRQMHDPEIAWLFENCFPNTLDTTVEPGTRDGKPDTFVITGDIAAMWLRDSAAQVWPYVPLAKRDPELRRLLEGVIRRHAQSILLDPYANAFMKDAREPPLTWSVGDKTDMKPGVGERKWEIDSLCYPVRLAHAYWKQSGDSSPFDDEWHSAARLIVNTFREQQRKNGQNASPYSFLRSTTTPNDTLNLNGYGNPARAVGMIFSGFRPSDDACIYPLFVPANLFAVVSLRQIGEMAAALFKDNELARDSGALADEVEAAVSRYARSIHGQYGEIWAYEVDGFGNQLFMDDANAPGLLGLPYLGCCRADEPLYQRTRSFALSAGNPYFFRGKAAEGIGGPHTGYDMIWPMSIMMRGLTSNDPREIAQCLTWLKQTHAGTGFMHESFYKDDAKKYTRDWFAWANSLFGELALKAIAAM